MMSILPQSMLELAWCFLKYFNVAWQLVGPNRHREIKPLPCDCALTPDTTPHTVFLPPGSRRETGTNRWRLGEDPSFMTSEPQ